MKKIVSCALSLVLFFTSLIPTAFTAYSEDYGDTLRRLGFPTQYIQKLVDLHSAHPNWIFEPFNTGLDWNTAVAGERSVHSKQLISKSSLYDSSMYCSCDKCFVNGKYVIQESKNWVSASKTAVEYYMNPSNWLDEKHIFQFESTAYDGTQTKQGVEAILNGTWMYDSLITYRTTSGKTKQYDSTTKYSDVIMKAANDAGISAYYLAAKIRQENGGAQSSATAVNGTTSPFQGIYNYFNIGAYSGAMDGLSWAAGFLKTNCNATLYSKYDSATGIAGGTATAIKKNQYMTWRADCGNYYFVRLYDEVKGSYVEGLSGYILKNQCRDSYLDSAGTGYGRPWTNPYKAIYYGAKYIAKSFGAQTSNYLQKFNVNPASNALYQNEYMKNVAGAANEAVSTYNGYASAGILDVTKKFMIPVFNGMPESPAVSNLTVAGFDSKNVFLTWSPVENASGYQVEIFSNNSWNFYARVSEPYLSVENLSPCENYGFRVVSYKQIGMDACFDLYSNEVWAATTPHKLSKPTATSTQSSVTIKWTPQNLADGYSVYIYDKKQGKYVYYADAAGIGTSSITLKGLKSNTYYKFKVLAYRNINGTVYTGALSSYIPIRTLKKNQIQLTSAKSSKKQRITVKWKKKDNVTGYQVMWSTTKNFKKNFLSVKVKGKSKQSTTLKTSRSKTTYYVRVRAYKTSKGKTTYYPWSVTKSVKVK